MIKLSKDSFNKASGVIMEVGRPLEKTLLQRYFHGGSSEEIINALKKFRNEDGGFGHGIESDFRLPDSSPMATSVGIRLLSEIDGLIESKEMIKAAINYLETSFNRERNGWFAVPEKVNDFPHAPWWHYNKEDGMTVIDKHWGNPSAEIIAYLYKYREYVKYLNVEEIIEYAISHIENKQDFTSENEIFCYIKLHKVLPEKFKKRLEPRLAFAINEVIVYDEKQWHEYIPRPIDFIENPDSMRFGVSDSKIGDHLDFIIKELESNGKILPPWGDVFYKEDLKEAYNEWIGELTLKNLVALDKFQRILK